MDSFEAMTEAEQADLLTRLAADARRRLRSCEYGGFPSDWDPDDLVLDVMEKYVNGDRRITDRANLEQHLFGGVRSVISALKKRRSSKVGIDVVGEREEDLGGRNANPETLLLQKERHEAVRGALEDLALADDELLELVDLLDKTGEYTVGELMERYPWTETEARRRRRKLSRALPRAEAMAKEAGNAKAG